LNGERAADFAEPRDGRRGFRRQQKEEDMASGPMAIPKATAESSPQAAEAVETAGKAIVNKDDFLKLLVAQIKNQNPLNPADGIEFLSQLAQFSQLEQLLYIREALEKLVGEVSPAAAAPRQAQGV
jgi:flagellar basal-body rod modification protein FlgD